jgi:hypothetical protein
MPTPKILFLDPNVDLIGRLGFPVELITERSLRPDYDVANHGSFNILPGMGTYRSTPELEVRIREITAGGVDYVVIGNNMGAGVPKAAAVAESLRAENTCVMWNGTPTDTDKAPYLSLGYTRFIRRADLPECLTDALKK